MVLPMWGVQGCSDNWDVFTPTDETEEAQQAIRFTGTVSASQLAQETRADGSIVNLNETKLPETKVRSYWRLNEAGNLVENKQEFHVGLFGCYTGQYTWAKLLAKATMTESEIDALSEDEQKERTDILANYYSANLFYNQKAAISAATSDGHNPLPYTPERFWSNNTLKDGSGNTLKDANGKDRHEYATFWAYYPYNETADPGSYGISISPSNQAEGKGMGSVKFTMHPDAAQQNDFMISSLMVDRSRDTNPLVEPSLGTYTPDPVPFTFHHMLAQVRLYAFIRGTDKLVYQVDGDGNPVYYAADETYTDAWGMEHTVTSEEAGKIQKIDETNSVRWARTEYTDVLQKRYRADITYSMAFNNIKTECTFTPEYKEGRATISYTEAETLGSATVNHYIMNPYWFCFDKTTGERYMLNDNYMYGHYESTPAYKREDASDKDDGIDWSNTDKWGDVDDNRDPLHYLNLTGNALEQELQNPDDKSYHYNYAPGNILMVVPQKLEDENVPNIVITAKGKDTKGNDITAKVTINMLQMNLQWESGFIYCYAFLDELMPGDDKVKGPESITVPFDPRQWGDQW